MFVIYDASSWLEWAGGCGGEGKVGEMHENALVGKGKNVWGKCLFIATIKEYSWCN